MHGMAAVSLEVLHPPLVLQNLRFGLHFERATQIQFEHLRWSEPHWRDGDRRAVNAELFGRKAHADLLLLVVENRPERINVGEMDFGQSGTVNKAAHV